MNKNEFTKKVATNLKGRKFSKAAVEAVLNKAMETLVDIILSGEPVSFYGFGTFSAREMQPREVIDFQTGERITIPGHKTPKFVPGKFFRRRVKSLV